MDQIELQGKTIAYQIRRRAFLRTMRITISSDAVLRVSASKLMPKFLIEQFIRAKKEWVLKNVTAMEEIKKKKIEIVDPKEKQQIKEKAIVSVLEKVKKWNETLGYEIKKITVKEQKTCWGSCTRSKHLNFNWRLGLLPDHLVDYVVVHELCHLKHFNHSARFWNHVAEMIPDYKACVREIREKGYEII